MSFMATYRGPELAKNFCTAATATRRTAEKMLAGISAAVEPGEDAARRSDKPGDLLHT